MMGEGGLYKSNSKLINALFRLAKQMDYKRSWVAFEFERQCNKPTLEEFKELCKRMSYKDVWAEIKYIEYYKSRGIDIKTTKF